MKVSEYKQILHDLPSYNLLELAEKYIGVSYNTLVSIHAQTYQSAMRKQQPQLKLKKEKFYERYRKGESIVNIAHDVQLAACLMAQLIIECQFGKKHPEYLKEPEETLSTIDPRLYEEITQCISDDVVYSPNVERIKHATGLEYEYILEEKLRNLGIPFATEGELRDRGYSHTPDCKLEIPIVINGMIVNWIDSKASFGDEYYLSWNKRDQFDKYVVRFGPGLVIYWFGFIEEYSDLRSSGLLVLDDFPSDGIEMLSNKSII